MKRYKAFIPLALVGLVALAATHVSKPSTATDIQLVLHDADVYETEAIRATLQVTASELFRSHQAHELARISELLRHSPARARSGESLYAMWIDATSAYLSLTASWNYAEAEGLVQEWRAASGGAMHPDLAWGSALTNYAWQARGSGYGDTVSDEGARKFRERLQAAAACLARVQQSERGNPALGEALLTVDRGLGSGLSTQREHARAARQADPESLSAACNLGGNLLPRWYGQPGDVERYVNEVAAQPGPLDGDEVYCRVGLARPHLREWHAK